MVLQISPDRNRLEGRNFFPWSIFSLPEQKGPRKIGFAVNRSVAYKDQRFYWPGHPYSSSQFVTALNTMTVERVKPRPLVAAIPYISSTTDAVRDEEDIRVGVDIIWKPFPAAAVTASLYPDFGAVEADDVVLNLSARETFSPKSACFFLKVTKFLRLPRVPVLAISCENSPMKTLP